MRKVYGRAWGSGSRVRAGRGGVISLRYPASCAECGAELAVGEQARWYGRGRVYGLSCHGRASGEGLKWWGGERVRASHCEDAPCCGCCGPNAAGGF
jgi:hypothetical protein